MFRFPVLIIIVAYEKQKKKKKEFSESEYGIKENFKWKISAPTYILLFLFRFYIAELLVQN